MQALRVPDGVTSDSGLKMEILKVQCHSSPSFSGYTVVLVAFAVSMENILLFNL